MNSYSWGVDEAFRPAAVIILSPQWRTVAQLLHPPPAWRSIALKTPSIGMACALADALRDVFDPLGKRQGMLPPMNGIQGLDPVWHPGLELG